METRWLLLFTLGSILGCGQGPQIPRAVVSGRVSYQGRPVADGIIVFVPTKDTKGPSTSAVISGGVYKAVIHGGVPVGTHRVEIDAFRTMAASANNPLVPGNGTRNEQYLPERYNRQSALDVTVDAKQEQTRDFDLK
jgi:hypothetical protein